MAVRTPYETLGTVKSLAPMISPVTALAAHLSFLALDNPNGNTLTLNGSEILIVQNAHVSDAGTITFTMRTDPYGRTGAVTAYSIAAGLLAAFRPSPVDRWGQATTAVLHIDCSAAGTMKLAVLRLT